MTCPSSEQLASVLNGLAAAAVVTHIDHCTTCQSELERLTADADSIGAELRRPGAPADAVSEMASALDRLRPAQSTIIPADSRRKTSQDEDPRIVGYEMLGVLGRGGQGVVYKARDEKMNRVVALKILTGARDGRFQREVEALARLQHPNIVQIYEVGDAGGRPYFTMEFVSGGSLAATLTGAPPPPRTAATLVQILANAIQAAHEAGVVHRDLKPANILISDIGYRISDSNGSPTEIRYPISDIRYPKISDFGLAKPFDAPEITASGMLVGTPSYMAPEQVSNAQGTVGPAADMYSLGAILYQLLTGRPPFQAAELMDLLSQVANSEPVAPRRLLPSVPRDLDTICLKCLEKNPAKRYATAAALAEDLRRFANHEPIVARPVGVPDRAWRWAKRNPALAMAAGVSVASLVLGVMIATGFAVRANRLAEQRRAALEEVIAEKAKTNDALDRVTAEKQRSQEALQQARDARDQARDALDVTTDEVLENLLSRQQQLGEREKAFLRKTLAQYQRLAAAGDDTFDGRSAKANGLYRCAAIRRRLGELDESIAAGREAVAIYRKLTDDSPNNRADAHQLARAMTALGISLRFSGQTENALATWREARYVLSLLAVGPTATTDALLDLAGVHGNLANVYSMTNNYVAAETSFRAAVALFRELADQHPDRPDFRQQLSGCQRNYGQLLTQLRRPREAEPLLQSALALQLALPEDASVREQIALSYSNLALMYAETGRQLAAVAAYDDARKRQTALVAEFPSTPAYRQQLSGTLLGLAAVLRRGPQLPQAIKLACESVEMRAKLVADFGRPDYKKDLASAQNTAGTMLMDHGRLADAGQYLADSAAAWKEIAATEPDHPLIANAAAGAMVNLAQVRLKEKNATAARRLLQDAVRYHTAALKMDPRDPAIRRYFRNNRNLLLEAVLTLNDHAAAAAAAEELAMCDSIPEIDTARAAWALARCAVLAQKDAAVADEKRTETVAAYRERSVSLLRQAVALGYRETVIVTKSPEFAPFRDRADVQSLLKEMEKPKP